MSVFDLGTEVSLVVMSFPNTGVRSVESCEEEGKSGEYGIDRSTSPSLVFREVVSDNDNIIVANKKSERRMTFMSGLAPDQYSHFFVKASESDEQSIARELTEEGNMV